MGQMPTLQQLLVNGYVQNKLNCNQIRYSRYNKNDKIDYYIVFYYKL